MTQHLAPEQHRRRARPGTATRSWRSAATLTSVAAVGLVALVGTTAAAFTDRVTVPVENLDGAFEISQPATDSCTDRVPASTPQDAKLVLPRAEADNIRRVPVPVTAIPTQDAAQFDVLVCNASALAGDLALTLEDRTADAAASPFGSLVFTVADGDAVLTGDRPVPGAAVNALNGGRGAVVPTSVAPDGRLTLTVSAWMVGDAPREHALQPVDIGVRVVGESHAGEPIVLEGVVR